MTTIFVFCGFCYADGLCCVYELLRRGLILFLVWGATCGVRVCFLVSRFDTRNDVFWAFINFDREKYSLSFLIFYCFRGVIIR